MKKANMSNKLWSEDEDIYLKKYFSTTKNEFLAEKLNRTKDSIVVRANKLGLKKINLQNGMKESNLLQGEING